MARRRLQALALTLLALCAPAQDGDDPGVRLVVLVSIDQLSHVALDPLGPHLGGGIARLQEHGLVFTRAELAHGVTETAPGHASLGTGCLPSSHGVVANDWVGRESGLVEYCFADPDERPLRQAGPVDGAGRSARNLRRPALAQLLRATDPASRSVSISGKDRAAIGMAGQADWCLWWDQARGGFQSSTAWGQRLPEWVRAWNARWVQALIDGPFGQGWLGERAAALADAPPDERPGEGGRRFPYARPQLSEPPTPEELGRLASFTYATPACDAFTVELAIEALEGHALGADEHVDLLALGLSGCDALGHPCGPGSREVADLLLCADAALAELFERLDAQVGEGRWIAALSADHGVMPLPEALAARGIPARRVSGEAVGEALRSGRAALEERYGSALGLRGDARGLTLYAPRLREARLEAAEVRALLARSVAAGGQDWVARALTWERLRAVSREGAEADPIEVLEAASFDEERAPDVSLVPREHVLVAMSRGTSHGTPHAYDRQVPLLFLGPGFEAGSSDEPVRTIDVVPTLLDRLGLPLPSGLDGRVILSGPESGEG
jgi:predicted AlkP superfamily pyrophosphatase or phosphodiesterase